MTRQLIARNLVVALTIALALVGFRPALAAPQQQEVTPGIYYSEPVTLPDGSEVDFSLFLSEDGSAGFITSLTDQSDAYNEYGTWEMTDDGLVSVTLTGDDEAEYDEPYTTTFSQDGDTLTTVDFDAEYFGEDGFSVTLAMTEEELMAVEADAAVAGVGGMYTSEAVIAEDGSVGVALLFLADDGTAQGNINYFDGVTPPDVQLGSWTDNEDGTITLLLESMLQVSADGAEPVAMDESIERIYEVGAEGELIGENLTLYPLASAELAAEETGTLVFVSELLPSADTSGRVVSLALANDGGAALATDYLNDEAPIVELGQWEDNGDETLTVMLLGTEDADYDEPVVIVFAVDGDILTAVEYDQELYGEEGLLLTLLADESGATDDASASEPGYVSFSSEELTSADTPGLVISFTFYEDGSFEAASDYMNDQPAVLEYGFWEEDDDANATVTITGDDNGDYEQPLIFTAVSQDDGSILAVNEEVFGADGLVLWPDEE